MKVKEENIIAMIETINKTNLFTTTVRENRGLLNVFSSVKATPEQSHDLLRFRQIGQDGLTNYINYYLLKNPSTKAPMHGNKLVTMAPRKKVGKRQMNQKEKEMKQVTKCLRQRLAWCNRTKQTYDPNQEQYSLLPRAICDENGNPHKGSKAIWKEKLKQRYSSCTTPVVLDNLPPEWTPQIAIIEGMFLIHCKPLRTAKTINDYALFLFDRFLLPHFKARVIEVHLLFDSPNQQQFNPKLIEQRRRDKGHKSTDHQHINFTPSCKYPQHGIHLSAATNANGLLLKLLAYLS